MPFKELPLRLGDEARIFSDDCAGATNDGPDTSATRRNDSHTMGESLMDDSRISLVCMSGGKHKRINVGIELRL
jgi:hypothetical protein